MSVTPLETDRLKLVEPDLEYARDIFEYASDARFVLHLGRPPDNDVAQTKGFIKSLIHDNSAGKRMYWFALFDGKCVGSLGFIFHGLREYREAEFGYGFSPSVWGKDIAYEAGKAVLDYGHEDLYLIRFRFYTALNNEGAIRGVERLGFERDFVIQQFYPHDDCQVLALTRLYVSPNKDD